MRQVASLIFLIFVMLGCVGSNVKDVKIDTNQNATEYLKFEGRSRGIPSLVAAEIIFPNTNRDSFPLIITQHGSSRDGGSFHSGRGRTDEMSMRLMKQAPKRGFAVASIDAFYGTSIKPGDKTKFPKAAEYAIDLKKIKWMLRTHIGSRILATMKFLRAIPTQQLILIIIPQTRIKMYWHFYIHKNRIKIKSLHLARGMHTIVF